MCTLVLVARCFVTCFDSRMVGPCKHDVLPFAEGVVVVDWSWDY